MSTKFACPEDSVTARSGGNRIQAERQFRADGKTIALWRFKEGPGAALYRDSSGNGYTLFPGGSLSVTSSRQVNYNMGCPKTRPAVLRFLAAIKVVI